MVQWLRYLRRYITAILDLQLTSNDISDNVAGAKPSTDNIIDKTYYFVSNYWYNGKYKSRLSILDLIRGIVRLTMENPSKVLAKLLNEKNIRTIRLFSKT